MSEPILPNLAEAAAAADASASFRERATRVGAVSTLSYTQAVVAVYDFDRERAGGLAKGMFLMAAKKEGDETFILLRVQKEGRLPSSAANDDTRQRAIESSANEGPWGDKLDEWMRDQLSLHAVECSVLGTFIQQDDGYRYAEDIENYYAVHELMVWKPDSQSLFLIVNHRHRTNDLPMDQSLTKIGTTRFAAAERPSATKADFSLNPTDVLKRRTVYLGMSRSGKSNGMKIVAEAIYRLRENDPRYRIGQLIFDLSGEYAQDNPQDGKALHRIHEALGLPRDDEVETYGLRPVPWDPERKMMKVNFFGDQFPSTWRTKDVEAALDQLLAGREIVKDIMVQETARYTKSFGDADLAVPLDADGNRGAQVRYRRAILAYQTALAAAGLTPPSWVPSVRGLFSDDLIAALSREENRRTDRQTIYDEAATILKETKKQGASTWSELETVFRALSSFVDDRKGGFVKFDDAYIASKPGGEEWADPRLRAIMQIFAYPNGPRTFQTAQQQHSPRIDIDFAERVVEDLRKGKLVIIDQSAGDPEQNRAAAERIMWRIFKSQQQRFRAQIMHGAGRLAPAEGHIVVFLEEAHNLLPRATAANNLQTVWARSAKEGSKLNIGMVLATQAPSSVMPEILSETDNWILSYLNSENERRVIAGYMDFADFLEQIGKVSEQGFVRIRTLSQAYTVPVQLDKFHIEGVPTEGAVATASGEHEA